ncbi:tyrosine-type recombinase/integrase [Paenibacillus amylolyticus]|uniref:Tyrosine recombinase, XerC n=1 Tax=Paenibacillus amylolyticus TaxID=1451 RepID=A0A117I1E5_PAEAM|nr:tyrosine-type recombinase/integrase [Paenibacillus amylolyticus]GAS82022.1 tyrosine recombinase, XerC [Paenibacillus amylolyticus]
MEIGRVIQESPATKVRWVIKSLPKAISEVDVTNLIDTASEQRLKDQMVLELLSGLAGRVSEIATIKLESINFVEKNIRIVGKGDKERLSPIHDNACPYQDVHKAPQCFIRLATS